MILNKKGVELSVLLLIMSMGSGIALLGDKH